MSYAETTAHDDAEMARRLAPDPASVAADDRRIAAEARLRAQRDVADAQTRATTDTVLAMLTTTWLQARQGCGYETLISVQEAGELRQLATMAERMGVAVGLRSSTAATAQG